MSMKLATFGPVGRPSRIIQSKVMKLKQPTPDRFLYLECSPMIAEQYRRLSPPAVQMPVASRHFPFNYRFDWPHAIPSEVREMTELLKEVLTMPRMPHLDFAITLDWYSIPPDAEHNYFRHTAAGDMVNKGKYWQEGQARRDAKKDISASIKDLLTIHPVLLDTPTLVTVPGSKADFGSFGERLAKHIATATGKELVQTQCKSGERKQRKEDSTVDLTDEFVMPSSLDGEVIILDDVYKSGTSMDAVALAARKAGATSVYGVAIAKTLAN